MTHGPKSKLYQLLPLVMIVAAFVVFFLAWFNHEYTYHNWLEVNFRGTVFGEDCEYAIAKGDPNTSYQDLLAKSYNYKKLKMPYRDAPVGLKPVVSLEEYLITKCRLDPRQLNKNGFAWVNLKKVYGRSAVFIDDNMILEIEDSGSIDFPLPPQLRNEVIEIVLISWPSVNAPRPGLASLSPILFSDSRDVIEDIRRSRKFTYIEGPTFRLAYYLALFLIFSVAWLFGIKFNDVRWMIVLTALLSIQAYLDYIPTGTAARWQYLAEQCFWFMESLALGCFVFSFMRLKTFSRSMVDLYFYAAAGVYIALTFLLPLTTQRELGLKYHAPYIFAFIQFFILVVLGLKHRKVLVGSRLKRVDIILVLCALAAIGYLVQFFLMMNSDINLNHSLNALFVTVFSVYLSVDLVVFHRQFLQEKNKRLEEEHEKERLEQRLILGRSVQDTLLPKKLSGDVGAYRYSFYYEPAQTMSGDWMYVWQNKQGQVVRIIFGDVMGKGPQAAIVMSSIMAFLQECKSSDKSLKDSIEYLNNQLFEVYGGTTTTTAAAVEFESDTSAVLYNCATPGWLHINSRDSVHFAKSSNPLGISPDYSPVGQKVTLTSKSLLLSFTDGVMESSRSIQRLMYSFENINTAKISAESVFNTIKEIGRDDVQEDDKTILLIKKSS